MERHPQAMSHEPQSVSSRHLLTDYRIRSYDRFWRDVDMARALLKARRYADPDDVVSCAESLEKTGTSDEIRGHHRHLSARLRSLLCASHFLNRGDRANAGVALWMAAYSRSRCLSPAE